MAYGITTSTTSDLEEMQRIVIAEARYTLEHAPLMPQLVEKFTLKQGEKQITVPKMSAFGDAVDLVEGVDLAQAEQLADTYVTLTTSEIGVKCIVTDKLIRQNNEDVFRMVGKLLGDSMARKVEKDGLGMLDGFSTSLGSAGTTLTASYLAAAVTRLEGKSEPAPRPYAYVAHPFQVRRIMDAVATVGTYPLPEGFSAEMLKNYWKGSFVIYGVPVFSTGLLSVDASDDAKGGVFSKSALAYVVSKEASTERERDISLRAYELVHVQDSDWVELDDGYGIEMLFDSATPSS